MMEQQYVQNVYDKIYKEFSDTRQYVWPCIKNFLSNKTKNEIGLEIGCGNCKNIIHSDLNITGIDICMKFIELHPELSLIHGDCCSLPFQDNSFDYSMSVACFHHLSTEKRRLKAIDEMIRVTKNTGIITLWAYEGNKFTKGDNLILWKNMYNRYYYIYSIDEIKKIVEYIQKQTLYVKYYYESKNWIVEFLK